VVEQTATAKVRALAQSAAGSVVGVSDEIVYAVVSPDFALTPGQDVHQDLLATDASRASGPFNILEALRLAGAVARSADPGVTIPAVKVRWSSASTNGTFFNGGALEAFIKGDRTSDSDEFDDEVLNHEYGHFLAKVLSRDDSPGGNHNIDDVVDPRLA